MDVSDSSNEMLVISKFGFNMMLVPELLLYIKTSLQSRDRD